MSRVLTDPNQATPEWLTRILHRQGMADHVEVRRVMATATAWQSNSQIWRLTLEYSNAEVAAPRTLLLKLVKPDVPAEYGRREVATYQLMHDGEHTKPPLPRCYASAWSDRSAAFHLLLEDLGSSHFQPEWPLPPKLGLGSDAVAQLGRFHALWWDRAEPREVLPGLSRQELEAVIERSAGALADMADFLGDRLSVELHDVAQKILDGFVVFARNEGRIAPAGRAGLTLTHGDTHLDSFLFPVAQGDICIIDWQKASVGVGTDDMADLLVPFMSRPNRQRLERPLLQAYHRALKTGGVVGYDFDACWRDYRASALRCLLGALQEFANGGPATSWWPVLENSIEAVRDLSSLDFFCA